MRRKSTRDLSGPKHRDPLDDLENERLPVSRPNPLVRSRTLVRSSFIDDRRRWAPGGQVAPRDATGRPARVSHQPRRIVKVARSPHGKPLQSRRSYHQALMRRLDNASPHFAEARNTFICLKRKVRRSVLFAFKRTKKGAGSPKRRNQWSEIQC